MPVRAYGSKQLLDRVKLVSGFESIPSGYWILGVRSTSDEPDQFDDKFYLFKGEEFITVTSGTTNPGVWSLKNFRSYGQVGSAVLKADQWYYGFWKYGLHKGRMKALRQVRPALYFRDSNRNDKSEEVGQLHKGNIGINFHAASYDQASQIVKRIGHWSYGCQVVNDISKYYSIINKVKNQDSVAYCLLNEF